MVGYKATILSNIHFREDITKPIAGSVKKTPDLLDFSSSKKTRKFYSILPERWNLAEKIEEEMYLKSEQAYQNISGEEDISVKKGILEDAREYLQVQFRTMEVGGHIYSHKDFWELPHGPILVSSWFEWLTGGSEEGWLGATIEKNLEPVLKIVAEIISDKKGSLWDDKLAETTNNAEVNNGNNSLVLVFLLREWSKLYKEKPHRVVFIEGEDDVQDISKQPFVHVRKVPQLGEDYEERIILSVMVGSTMVFEDIGLSSALACVIEICFIFNLCYDKDADNTLNFIQRTLGGFGDLDGARNVKGKVKGSFLSFQAEFGRIMVEKKLGSVKKLFA